MKSLISYILDKHGENENITVFYMQKGGLFTGDDVLALTEIAQALPKNILQQRVTFYPVKSPLSSFNVIKTFEELLKWNWGQSKLHKDNQEYKNNANILKSIIRDSDIRGSDIDDYINNDSIKFYLDFLLSQYKENKPKDDDYPQLPDSTIWIIIGRPQYFSLWQKGENKWFRKLILKAGYPARYLIPPSPEKGKDEPNKKFGMYVPPKCTSLYKMFDRKKGMWFHPHETSETTSYDYGLVFHNRVIHEHISRGVSHSITICAGLGALGTCGAAKFISDPIWWSQLVGIEQVDINEAPIEVALRIGINKDVSKYIGQNKLEISQLEILNNHPIDYIGQTYWTNPDERPYSYVKDEKRIIPGLKVKEFAKAQNVEKTLRSLYTLMPEDVKKWEDIYEIAKWCKFNDPTNVEYSDKKPMKDGNGIEMHLNIIQEFVYTHYRLEKKREEEQIEDYYICGRRTKEGIIDELDKYIKRSRNEEPPKPILILGDSGTGKEKLYQFIRCKREYYMLEEDKKDLNEKTFPLERPFKILNCAEYGDNLKSILTDYGILREVNDYNPDKPKDKIYEPGVLVLDEFGEMSRETQGALLRILQEGTFDAKMGEFGSSKNPNKAFIIAGTSRPLEEWSLTGKILPDLLPRFEKFKLNPFTERSEDAVLLLFHYLFEKSKEKLKEDNSNLDKIKEAIEGKDKNITKEIIKEAIQKTQSMFIYIRPTALQMLLGYTFPGNIRSLLQIRNRLININKVGQNGKKLYCWARLCDNQYVVKCPSNENLNMEFLYNKIRKLDTEKDFIIFKIETVDMAEALDAVEKTELKKEKDLNWLVYHLEIPEKTNIKSLQDIHRA